MTLKRWLMIPAGIGLVYVAMLVLSVLVSISILVAHLAFSGQGTSPSNARDASGLPVGPVSYREVSSHREATLHYPGSHLYSRFGSYEHQVPLVPGGPDAAFAGGVWTTTVGWNSILPWYERWLTNHGWQRHPFPQVTTWVAFHYQGYSRGTRESFIVAQDNVKLLGGTLGRRLPLHVTIYEISHTILPYGHALPAW